MNIEQNIELGAEKEGRPTILPEAGSSDDNSPVLMMQPGEMIWGEVSAYSYLLECLDVLQSELEYRGRLKGIEWDVSMVFLTPEREEFNYVMWHRGVTPDAYEARQMLLDANLKPTDHAPYIIRNRAKG